MIEGVHVQLLAALLLAVIIQGTQGQAIQPLSTWVAQGDGVSLECTTAATGGFLFSWFYIPETGDPILLFNGGFKTPPEGYDNFNVSESPADQRSTLIINDIQWQDRGGYRCTVTAQPDVDPANVVVEVQPPRETMTLNSSPDYRNYIATCASIGSFPGETITWSLNGINQTDGVVPTGPTERDDSLFDTTSEFTFPATIVNYNVELQCIFSGHQVDKLNGAETRLVDIHNPPEAEGITIGFNSDGTDLTVSCEINNAVDAAIPPMGSFYIYSNGTLITEPVSANSVTVSEPDYDTEYMCVGENYLGNTTAIETFYPGRTTTPTPPTAPDTTEPVAVVPTGTGGTGMPTDSPLTTNSSEGGPGEDPKVSGLGAGAIAGIAVGAIIFIALIIVLIVVFVVKPDCIGGSGSPNTTTTHKHSTSAVGSSNGNEKEKIRPEAAPRGHSSIKHTTDNPQQAEYAMVDRRPGGRGDSTDARGNGAGQNEQPGMHYADLDLTSSAGHSDRVVPKNEDGVVVYSSILV